MEQWIELSDRYGNFALKLRLADLHSISADGDSAVVRFRDGDEDPVDNTMEELGRQVEVYLKKQREQYKMMMDYLEPKPKSVPSPNLASKSKKAKHAK